LFAFIYQSYHYIILDIHAAAFDFVMEKSLSREIFDMCEGLVPSPCFHIIMLYFGLLHFQLA